MEADTFENLLDLDGLTFLLTDLVGEAVVLTDAAGRVRYWNPAAERTYGWGAVEALGKELSTILPSLAESAQTRGGGRRAGNTSRDVVVTDRVGRRFAARVTQSALTRNGAVVGTAIVLLDQTARVVAEAAAAAADRRLRSIVSNAHDLVVLLDGQGVVAEAFGGVHDLIGRTAEGLIGKLLVDVIHRDDLPSFHAAGSGRRLRAEGVPTKHRFRLLGEGGPRWAEGERIDLLDDPAVHAIVWNVRDVQDEVEAEAQRRSSEAQLRALFNENMSPQVVATAAGVVLAANTAFHRLVGVSTESTIGRAVGSFWTSSDAAVAAGALDAVVSRQAPIAKYEATCAGRSGRFPISVTVTPLIETDEHYLFQLGDLRERTRSSANLHAVEGRLEAVVAHAPVVLATYDTAGTIDYWGGNGANRPEGSVDLLGANIFEIFAGEEAGLTATRIALAGGETDVRLRIDGVVWDVHHAPIRDDDTGLVVGGVFVGVDVTARTHAEERINASEARMQALLRTTSDVIVIKGIDGVLRYVSPSVTHVLGYHETALVGRTLTSLVGAADLPALERARTAWHGGRAGTVEVEARHASGATRVVELSGANLIDDPAVGGIVVTIRDLTDRRNAEEAAILAMAQDALTGLPNRVWLMRQDRESAFGAVGSFAVVLVNLDAFALINTSFGQEFGNRALQAVARRLIAAQEPGDTVCRLGSDEFAIVMPGVVHADELLLRAGRFLSAVADDIVMIDGHGLWLSASAGVAPPNGRADVGMLLRQADAAARSAKTQGVGRAELFGAALAGVAARRLGVESGLRTALANGELRLHYQPVVDMHSGSITGVEALVRWLHPTEGLLPPAEFLPIAEQSRLIVDIGRWVLAAACDQAAEWERAWPERRLTVSLNLSARHLMDPRLLEDLKAALEESGVTPARMRLEITETSVMADADAAVRTLRLLKATGVRVSIDDFGTGWSSLAYLKNLPVDELKIDRSFVSGLGTDAGDAVIVASIVGLAAALGLEVVAEGVETVDQHRVLVRQGVRLAQGYIWSQPIPPDEMNLLLARDETYAGIARELDDLVSDYTEPSGDLLSMLAHELCSPLTVITGYCEILEDRAGGGDAKFDRAMSAIGRNARLAATLIQTIADLARLGDGTLPLALETVDVAALVAALVADVREGTGALVTFEGPADPIQVYADGLRLQQIVWNLLTNALKFGPPGVAVVVRVFSYHEEAYVEVIDAGPGIAPEDAARMFRKYSRLNTVSSGTGLGLFLAHQLAEALGGDLAYESVATGGSRFRLTLPSPAESLGQPALSASAP